MLGRYASSIEKYCADQLKEYGLVFDYEEHTFQLTERFKFPNKYFKMTAKGKEMADRSGSTILPITYKPDFVGRDHDWIIETKGYLPSHHDFPMRWKLFGSFSGEPIQKQLSFSQRINLKWITAYKRDP